MNSEYHSHRLSLLLSKEDIEVNAEDNEGRTLFQYAVKQPKTAIIQSLLKYNNIDLYTTNQFGMNFMHYDYIKRATELLELYLSIPNIQINSLDNQRFSLLHQASGRGHVHFLAFLLSQPSIDVKAIDCCGRNASEVVELLAQACCTHQLESISTCLHWKKEYQRISSLLRMKARTTSTTNGDDRSELILHDFQEQIQYLEQYSSPLHCAVQIGDVIMLTFLLDNHLLDVDTPSHKYCNEVSTPIHVAVRQCNSKCPELLLTHPTINTNIKDNKIKTPLKIVQESWNRADKPAMVDLPKQHRAGV